MIRLQTLRQRGYPGLSRWVQIPDPRTEGKAEGGLTVEEKVRVILGEEDSARDGWLGR